MILSHGGDQYSHLDTLIIKICPLFQILLTEQDVARSLVPILATKEALVPLANDPIMLGWSIWSYRHLKRQNPSTGDDFINDSGIIFLVQFLATKEALAPLANNPIMSHLLIQLFRHLKHQNLSTGDDFVYSSGMIFLVLFLLTSVLLAKCHIICLFKQL